LSVILLIDPTGNPTNRFVVFDPAVSVDPTEIKQFLPYLHSDPNRIIGRGIESEPRSATNVKEESQCHGAAVTVRKSPSVAYVLFIPFRLVMVF